MPPRRRKSPRKPSCALIIAGRLPRRGQALDLARRDRLATLPRPAGLGRAAARAPGEEILVRLPHRGAGPDAALEQSELEAALHRAIAEMADERRIVVVGGTWKGWPTRIAEVAGTRARHGPLASAPGPRRPQGQAGALLDMSCHDAREWLWTCSTTGWSRGAGTGRR